MKIALGVALGVLAAVVVACGGAMKTTAPVAASQRSVIAARPDREPIAAGPEQAHDQIEQLSAEVERQRVDLQLPAPPDIQAMSSTPPAPPPARDPSCPKAASDTCTSVCTLSDSICGNATKICSLATQLPGDDWAAGKCTQATDTCKASQERCCACQ